MSLNNQLKILFSALNTPNFATYEKTNNQNLSSGRSDITKGHLRIDRYNKTNPKKLSTNHLYILAFRQRHKQSLNQQTQLAVKTKQEPCNKRKKKGKSWKEDSKIDCNSIFCSAHFEAPFACISHSYRLEDASLQLDRENYVRRKF
jgi:hypothetical protein